MELSLTHILLLFGILILFFGPARLPKLGAALGETIKQFKGAMNEPNQSSNHTQSQSSAQPPRAQELPAASASDASKQTAHVDAHVTSPGKDKERV